MTSHGRVVRKGERHSLMRPVVMLVPADLETRPAGYEYCRRIVCGLRERGWSVELRALDGSFPRPTPPGSAHAARVLAGIPDDALVVVDGLCFGAVAAGAPKHASRLRLVALVHHPLARETDFDEATKASMGEYEQKTLAAASHVIVTSTAAAALVGEYGVGLDRVTVVN